MLLLAAPSVLTRTTTLAYSYYDSTYRLLRRALKNTAQVETKRKIPWFATVHSRFLNV
jgi:hypothetical protein